LALLLVQLAQLAQLLAQGGALVRVQLPGLNTLAWVGNGQT
jgi:hypothetical protein